MRHANGEKKLWLAGIALIAIAILSLVLVACGSSGNNGSSGTQGTIKIGAPLPLTGAYAADGQHMQMGLKMAVKDLNDQGGVLGKKVELVTYDIEELLPETVNSSAAYLLGKEKVDAVIEGYGGYGPDFLAYGAKSDVPFIHGSGSERGANLLASDPAKYGNMFQVFSIESTYGKRAWEGLTSFEDKYTYPNHKIAILHGDLEWDLKYTAAVAAEAKKAGWEVVMNETFPYGTTDWGSVLAKIRADKPAVICCSVLSVKDIASFVNQFMEDPTPSLLDISYMVVFTEVQDACGNNLTGVMGYVTSYVAPTAPNAAEWKARFKTMFNMDVPLTTPPSTYDSVMIWAQAAEAVGDSTKYADICEYIKTHPYEGLLGTYDFNNPQQTIVPSAAFVIPYAQYLGDGTLAFDGTDPFIFPPYINPAWPAK